MHGYVPTVAFDHWGDFLVIRQKDNGSLSPTRGGTEQYRDAPHNLVDVNANGSSGTRKSSTGRQSQSYFHSEPLGPLTHPDEATSSAEHGGPVTAIESPIGGYICAEI